MSRGNRYGIGRGRATNLDQDRAHVLIEAMRPSAFKCYVDTVADVVDYLGTLRVILLLPQCVRWCVTN
jgi:hypothetical protein